MDAIHGTKGEISEHKTIHVLHEMAAATDSHRLTDLMNRAIQRYGQRKA